MTYKTAWRMGHEIRKYMAAVDGDAPLSGVVEVDETFVGGRTTGQGRGNKVPGNKAIVFGMAQRGGPAMTKVIPDTKRETLHPLIRANIKEGSTLYSDAFSSYRLLARNDTRGVVDHSKKEYVRGDVHTNTIESVWAQ